jgi:hypothetical protein
MVAPLSEVHVMTLHKALALGVGCALVDILGARLLDSVGFVQGLLAPNGAQLRLLIPLACAFYGARLITYFVLPPLVVATLASAARPLARSMRCWRDGIFRYRGGAGPGSRLSAGDDRLRGK